MIARAHKSARKLTARKARDKAEKLEMAREIARLRILVHILLTQIQKLTESKAVTIPEQVLRDYPADAVFHKSRDAQTGAFRFWVEIPEDKDVIQPSRRIILPT